MPITNVADLRFKIANYTEQTRLNVYSMTIGTVKSFFSGNFDQIGTGHTFPTTLTQEAQTTSIYSKIKAPVSAGSSLLVTNIQSICGSTGGVTGGVSQIMFDYLVGAGGINIATATEQVFTVAALPRHTDGVGVYAMIVSTSALGGTSCVGSMRYLANDNVEYNSPSVIITLAGNSGSNAVMILPLANGTKGIKEVRGFTSGGGSVTGTLALLLFKPVATIPQVGSVFSYDDVAALHMPFFKFPKDGNIMNFQNGTAALNIVTNIKVSSVSDT
ncbi:MAG: hypothetical protein IPL34_20405 [Thiofilum sp.]|uniref:hypothetical protein n=1 Tax=Thiofilum sp. TaxID=2212733 RepID=UPI0025F63C3F|nr:hypothetical protein [Thiofilum sp.]MBK8455645.1 hypothetical protein [Thiofilum sp.]